MNIALIVAVFVAGIVILTLGADWLVKGASGLAIRMGVTPIVIGLTVVAFGTSAPELLVSVMAAISGSSDVALGNVVGSNIANVGLIVGITAILLPVPFERSFLKMDMPLLFGAMVLLFVCSWDGVISRFDGGAMIAALVFFIALTFLTADKREREDEEAVHDGISVQKGLVLMLIGLVGLAAGAQMMVWSAIELARLANISELVIGSTIVAVGTSLPELATSIIAVLKKQPDIGLGNVIGSNIFNICSILGIAPLVSPLIVSKQILFTQFPIMVAFSAILALMFMKRKLFITKPEGAFLLLLYSTFMFWAFYTG
jgi:cation:H+ antiporter